MTSGTNQRGVALLAVLGLILAVLPLAAAVCIQTNLDGLMQRHARGSAQAFYTAEAGLAHALAEIGPAASPRSLLYGPDGISGTADDNQYPFRARPHADLPYDVRVAVDQTDTILLHSTGHGAHDAVRELELAVARSEVPFTPGAIFIEAVAADFDLGAGGFSLSGLPSGDGRSGAAPVAAVAVTSGAVAADLRASLPAAQIAGPGETPSVVATTPLDLGSYVTTLRSRLEAVIFASAPPGGATAGTATHPQLTVIDGNWRITDDVEGFGVLVVRGNLEIDAGVRFGGLVVVSGDVRLAEAGNLQVEGALWIHRSGRAKIDLLGTGFVRYDPGNLRRTTTALEDTLLHLPEVVGWRELS